MMNKPHGNEKGADTKLGMTIGSGARTFLCAITRDGECTAAQRGKPVTQMLDAMSRPRMLDVLIECEIYSVRAPYGFDSIRAGQIWVTDGSNIDRTAVPGYIRHNRTSHARGDEPQNGRRISHHFYLARHELRSPVPTNPKIVVG
jgi:hypothetical protein